VIKLEGRLKTNVKITSRRRVIKNKIEMIDSVLCNFMGSLLVLQNELYSWQLFTLYRRALFIFQYIFLIFRFLCSYSLCFCSLNQECQLMDTLLKSFHLMSRYLRVKFLIFPSATKEIQRRPPSPFERVTMDKYGTIF
jgi:hypothetical protein